MYVLIKKYIIKTWITELHISLYYLNIIYSVSIYLKIFNIVYNMYVFVVQAISKLRSSNTSFKVFQS